MIPVSRENVVLNVPVLGFFHSVEPLTVLVNAIWSPPVVVSPTTIHMGEAAPALYAIALLPDITGGIAPVTPATVVAVAHPLPTTSSPPAPVSARHEILLAGAPLPPPPPPQQIHAAPLYPTDVMRIPGSTDDTTARHPVAPVRSLV